MSKIIQYLSFLKGGEDYILGSFCSSHFQCKFPQKYCFTLTEISRYELAWVAEEYRLKKTTKSCSRNSKKNTSIFVHEVLLIFLPCQKYMQIEYIYFKILCKCKRITTNTVCTLSSLWHHSQKVPSWCLYLDLCILRCKAF